MSPHPVELRRGQIPHVADWSEVSEVQLHDALLDEDMKQFVIEANHHHVDIHAMTDEARLSLDRYFT